MLRLVIGTQAAYYFVSAMWPLVSMGSFEAVTGPKTDLWLVRTVALLILVIAVTLGLAALGGQLSLPIRACALLACLVFIGVDTTYALSGVISKMYLSDAALEALLLTGLLIGLRHDAARGVGLSGSSQSDHSRL